MELNRIGVTPAKEKQFNKKRITDCKDLLEFIPRKYEDCTTITGILPKDTTSCVSAVVNSVKVNYSAKTSYVMAACTVVPGQERLTVFWFHQDYLYNRIAALKGKTVFIAGRISHDSEWGSYSMSNPFIFKEDMPDARTVHRIYPKIAGMGDDYLQGKIAEAWKVAGSEISDPLPSDLVHKYNLLPMRDALHNLHLAQNMSEVRCGQDRLLFNDLERFALAQEYIKRNSAVGSPFQIKTLSLYHKMAAAIGFELTTSQYEALSGIHRVIQDGKRLNGILQGDVGSGKTVVAFLAMAMLATDYQTVLVAPTKILAGQHYAKLKAITDKIGIEPPVYVHSELKAAEKKEALKRIGDGSAKFIVGTHAVMGKDVVFKNLALAIFDEEQRYGVEQQETLLKKAPAGVHTLAMSATLIPATLAKSIYSSSVQTFTLTAKPAGRLPIKTAIPRSRESLFKFLASEITGRHHQAYVVCPTIDDMPEDLEGDAPASINKIEQEYKAALGPSGIRIATLTGRSKKSEAEAIIEDFRSGLIDILISTTVIEVGVDCPNASVIVICSAERFGLAQLHQLRGRVGRSSIQSYCALETNDRDNERLKAMCITSDGFELARKDLELRGVGAFLGTKQHGKNVYLSLALRYPKEYELARKIAPEVMDYPESCDMLNEIVNHEIDI